jgi:hypothetical protein
MVPEEKEKQILGRALHGIRMTAHTARRADERIGPPQKLIARAPREPFGLVHSLLFTVVSAGCGGANRTTARSPAHMAPRGNSENQRDARNNEGSAAVARLRRAIESATVDGHSRSELEEAARELVAELKDASHPPEQMLLQIKQLLAEAGLRPSYATPSEPETRIGLEATIYRDVIAWSIRHYYDGKER